MPLLLLLPFLLLLLLPVVRPEQRIVEEPEDTVARLGETVLLRCRVHNQKGQVMWMKGDLGLGTRRELPFFERMTMVGSNIEGEYHLEIREVQLEDEDNYQCQLSATDEEPRNRLSRRARLTVIVEPQTPVLLGESVGGGLAAEGALQRTQPVSATEGVPVRLSCQSRAGKPPAQLGWALAEDWQAQRLIAHIDNGTANSPRHTAGGSPAPQHLIRVRDHSAGRHPPHHIRHQQHQPLSGNITEFVELDEQTRLSTVTSHLTLSPGVAENGRWLVCFASHSTYGKESRTASVQLDVFYAPKVRVAIVQEGSQLLEGGNLRLSCASDARPNDALKYSWAWDGEQKRLEVLDEQNAIVSGLRFNDNGKRVSCRVENSIGPGTGILELDVPYGPRFMSTNQTRTVERGSEVTFQCEALGNPPPTVRWFHGRDVDTPIHEGKNYTIRNAQDWEEGDYRCTAEVEGFPPKTLHHQLYLKGPPKVRMADDFVAGSGNSITLACQIQSRALPVRVHWFHNGHRVDIDMPSNPEERRYQVQDEKLDKWELLSRLTIVDFTEQDFGQWNCSARNEYGTVWDQREVYHRGILERMERFFREQPTELKVGLVAVPLCALLSLALFLCCLRRCCDRARGHSKLSSNYSSDPKGNISVECEDVTMNSSSTPPYAPPFYSGGGTESQHQHAQSSDYLCGPAQFNPELDRQQQQQFGPTAYSPGALAPPGHLDYFGTLSSSHSPHQMLPNGGTTTCTFGSSFGAGSTFGPTSGTQLSNLYEPPTNSFGCVVIPRPQLAAQQQQFYPGYGPNQLEPVTEVCTPESIDGLLLNGGQNCIIDPLSGAAERTISRISTHV